MNPEQKIYKKIKCKQVEKFNNNSQINKLRFSKHSNNISNKQMITRRFLLHKKLLTHNRTLLNSSLHHRPHSRMSTVSQWVRKFMNRIRFEDNRALQATQDKVSIEVLQTPKQVQEKFIGDQNFKSVVEKQRMQKIDQIIGTRTYFHETKMYQQRVDSDHVMLIEELAKKHPQPRRENLNWQNPQAPQQYKIKSTRKFYRNLKNLRQYPRHNYRISNFNDQQSQENIEFLGKESLFSKLSLKWVDTYQKSLQNQTVEDVSYELQSHRYSPMYVYFSTSYNSSKLYRVPCAKYTSKLLTSVTAFEQIKIQIEQVVSLEEIYDTLKEYFHDERVTQWLKKVENGNIQYMLSGYKTSKGEDSLIVWVDLLGTKKEYVHIYKKLRKNHQTKSQHSIKNQPQQPTKSKPQQQHNHITTPYQQNTHITQFVNKIVFNCKPSAVFSQTNDSIYMIQRSEEGGFVQLIQVPITQNHGLGKADVLYKCKPYEEMDVWSDQGQGYLFLKVTEIGEVFKEKVYIVEERLDGEGIELIQVVNEELEVKKQSSQAEPSNNSSKAQTQTQTQTKTKAEHQPQQTSKSQQQSSQQKKSRISLGSCGQGLIVCTYYPTEDYFKYGSSREYATSVTLIPYKKHIQMQQQSNQRVDRQFQLSGQSINREKPSARQLDFGNRTTLFQCPEEQFITEVSVRQSHIIISLSTLSIYTKKRLLFIPYQQSKNPHSLVFSSLKLSFVSFGYNYSSQLLNFMLNRSSVFSEYYQYTIWKKQLKQMTSDNVYIEKTRVNQNVELTFMCLNKFLQHLPKFYKEQDEEQSQQLDNSQQQQHNKYKLQNSQVPILIYLTDTKHNNNNNSQLNLRKFLEKGTMIVTISSRGTLTSDLITFYKGSGENFQNMIQDLQHSIQWLGNNLGANISLYAKGNISALVGMMLNVRHPFLLTSTVLHDGAYEVMGKNVNYNQVQYFTKFYNEKATKEEIEKYWQLYSPASFRFKRSLIATQKTIAQQPHQSPPQDAQQSQSVNQQDQPPHDQTTTTIQSQPQQIQQKIGTLQNIIVSCSPSNYAKNQARRMIYHLRRNPNFKYDEVFLKEFLQGEDEELFNLSYIYGKMKERLELEYRS